MNKKSRKDLAFYPFAEIFVGIYFALGLGFVGFLAFGLISLCSAN